MDSTREKISNTNGNEHQGNTARISIIGNRYPSPTNYHSTWNALPGAKVVEKIETYSSDRSINQVISISASTRKYKVTSPSNADASSYDPHDFSKTINCTGFYGTIFHLIIISAGPTMLTLPKIYLKVGIFWGIFGTLFMVTLYNHCCHIFVKTEYDLCKRKKIPSLTYADTIYYAFLEGPTFFKVTAIYARYLTFFVFVVPWLGGNSVNLILIADNLKLVLKLLYGYDIGIHTVMIYVFIPLLILCWIPNLKYLVPISMLGTFLNFLVILIVIYHISFDTPVSHQSSEGNLNLIDIPLFFGSILFCTNAMAILMPLKNEMNKPRRFSSTLGVLNISNFFIALLYAAFNVSATLKYGTVLQNNVVMNLPQDQFATKLTIIMFVMAVCFQFPLVSYTVYDLFWNILLKEKKAKLNNLFLWEYVVRTTVVIGAYVMAFAVPSVEIFLTILGTLASSVDGLIFPCVIQQLIRYEKLKSFFTIDKIFVKNFLIFCIGVIMMLSGLVSCLNKI